MNTKETNNPIMKWVKDMKRNLTEEDIDMANMNMEKCLHYLPSGKYKSKPQ